MVVFTILYIFAASNLLFMIKSFIENPYNDNKAFLLVPPYKDVKNYDFLTGDFKFPSSKNDSHLFCL